MSYLFESSVLDVELLGINKVKQFAVLFSKGKEKAWVTLAEIHNIGSGLDDMI